MQVSNKDKKEKLPDLADLIKPDLILLDAEAKDREDAILLGCNLLVDDGAVTEEYCNLILRSLEETKIHKVMQHKFIKAEVKNILKSRKESQKI